MMSVIFRGFSLISGVFRRSLAVFAEFSICSGELLTSRLVFCMSLDDRRCTRIRCKCNQLYFVPLIAIKDHCHCTETCAVFVFWPLSGCVVFLHDSHSFTQVIPERFLINDQSPRQQVLSVLVNIC